MRPKYVWEQLSERAIGQGLGAMGELPVGGFTRQIKVPFTAVVAKGRETLPSSE